MRRLLIALPLVVGCLEPTADDRARDELPGEGRDHENEFHRPGQPCLLCHNEFEVAGTVFLRAEDATGLDGAEVVITDDDDREIVARTNRAGNFLVVVSDDRDTENLRAGMVRVPLPPTFPLSIEVRHAGHVTPMETQAWREGSCAGCHKPALGADSVGPVFLLEPGEPL